jgi:hypothetical protein
MNIKEELAAIKARCEAATPGEWIYDERVGCAAVYAGASVNCLDDLEDDNVILMIDGVQNAKPDNGQIWTVDEQKCRNADFIAHSRQDIPLLLNMLDKIYDISSTAETRLLENRVSLKQLDDYLANWNGLIRSNNHLKENSAIKAERQRVLTDVCLCITLFGQMIKETGDLFGGTENKNEIHN